MDNYQKQCEQWRQWFLTLDQDDLCRRLPELQRTGGHLALWHFGRQLGVDRRTGAISSLSDGAAVDITPQLNVYTLFRYALPGAKLSGEWVPFRDLKDGGPFAPAFQRGVLTALARTFSGREDRLERAVEALRGCRIHGHGFLLHAFACIPVQLLFWDGDEEFPAQANLLFDRNATDFIHVESIVTIAGEALCQLAEAAALPIGGSPFPRV